MRKSFFIALMLGVGTLLVAQQPNTTFSEEKENALPAKATAVNKNLLLQTINEIRRSGLPCVGTKAIPVKEVTWSDELAFIAEAHSRDMYDYTKSVNNSGFIYLSHIGTDGSTLADRLLEHDYFSKIYVENIAYYEYDEATLIDSWLNTPEHCKNMMNEHVTKIGVGRVGNFWTLIMAKPSF